MKTKIKHRRRILISQHSISKDEFSARLDGITPTMSQVEELARIFKLPLDTMDYIMEDECDFCIELEAMRDPTDIPSDDDDNNDEGYVKIRLVSNTIPGVQG